MIRGSVGALISEVNQVAMNYAGKHAGELLGTKWYDGEKSTGPSERWPVSESAKLAVRRIVTEAFSRNTPMSELISAIAAIGEFSRDQAQIIAETEVSFAQSRGNLEAWKRSGVVRKIRWQTSSLHLDRDDCDMNREAGAIPLGANFPSGVPAPPAHIGCHCTAAIAELTPQKK